MKRLFFACAVGASLAASEVSLAAQPLYVYGPGGPFPAIKEAAAAFSKQHGVDVIVTAGPTPKWIADAKSNADVIYSGSETMMTTFIGQLDGAIETSSVIPLYLRPAAILVRPGNPDHITGIADLMKPGQHILVVNGAGQQGLWEDVAGRLGDINSVKAFRANIKTYAGNSAEARKAWVADKSLNAWLIWNIWQVSNPKLATVVSIEPQYEIYRDAGVALTHHGEASASAKAFVAFLQSAQGQKIFAHWGWMVPSGN